MSGQPPAIPSAVVQAVATPSEPGILVDLLDEHWPRWEIALHRAKPWRVKAPDGSTYRERHVRDPRSDVESSFRRIRLLRRLPRTARSSLGDEVAAAR